MFHSGLMKVGYPSVAVKCAVFTTNGQVGDVNWSRMFCRMRVGLWRSVKVFQAQKSELTGQPFCGDSLSHESWI